jgi:hypothetical protein
VLLGELRQDSPVRLGRAGRRSPLGLPPPHELVDCLASEHESIVLRTSNIAATNSQPSIPAVHLSGASTCPEGVRADILQWDVRPRPGQRKPASKRPHRSARTQRVNRLPRDPEKSSRPGRRYETTLKLVEEHDQFAVTAGAPRPGHGSLAHAASLNVARSGNEIMESSSQAMRSRRAPGVLGPVERRAISRFAAICFPVATLTTSASDSLLNRTLPSGPDDQLSCLS